MSDISKGELNEQPGHIVIAESHSESPVPRTVTAYAAHLAVTGKRVRTAQAKWIVEGGHRDRLPNAVEPEADMESLLNERFVADALFELRERPGILVSGEDPHVFEALPVETLRTEAGDLFDLLNAEIDRIDPSKQALVLASKPILLTVEEGDRKTRKPFHLVRLAKTRSYIERTGIPLELPSPVGSQTEAAS